jgi:dTDP-4-amino-4,6-dideoxygalactose transaminase
MHRSHNSRVGTQPWVQEEPPTIPILRPQLPSAERLLPYLRRIDASRNYTNWGPLACELESRLSRVFGEARQCVVTTSSGTAALVGAILGTAGRAKAERPLALIPAFTFVATAAAVEQCGYMPHLVDVDPDTWLLDVDQLQTHPLLERVGLVVPVAAFGRPVPQAPLASFRSKTGIPVVIDGAASFEAVASEPWNFTGDIPLCMSFHATKSFATAEGGCIVTKDKSLLIGVTQALNFGFYFDRCCRSPSFNGKMSEYHAAVGHASLDEWPRQSARLRGTANLYRKRMEDVGLADRLVATPSIAGCYLLFRCANDLQAARVQQSLTESRIEFRFWYGKGVNAEPYYQQLSHDDLPVTEALARLTIGLPIATDLSESAIDRVVSAIETAL